MQGRSPVGAGERPSRDCMGAAPRSARLFRAHSVFSAFEKSINVIYHINRVK